MFSITGQRRRRFANFVNRNLERALMIRQDNNNRIEETEEEVQNQVQRIAQIRAILASIPRGVRRLVANETLQRIREALSGLRIDQLPAEILEQLNELF